MIFNCNIFDEIWAIVFLKSYLFFSGQFITQLVQRVVVLADINPTLIELDSFFIPFTLQYFSQYLFLNVIAEFCK